VSGANAAAEILVEGHVQGVGYRDYARRRAALLGLAGWVMNLRDGRVRLRAEGPRPVIEDLVRVLEKGPPLSRVERVEVRWLPATGRFANFDIRFAEFEP
jgi:acylphosphatase